MISVSGIRFSYGKKSILNDFSEVFSEGSITSLMGVSGCGKSTLMRLMAGLERPIDGRVSQFITEERQQDLFYCFQDFDAFPWLTVAENVELVQGIGNRKDCSSQSIINRVGLLGHQKKYPRELSGGMRKRLAFARVLASGAKFVLLDEVFASLDVIAKSQLYTLIESELLETGKSFLVVTHSIEEAIHLSDRVLVCDGPPLTKIADIKVGFPRPRAGLERLDSEFSSTFGQIEAAFRSIERSRSSDI